MTNWKEYKLGGIAKFHNGRAYKNSEFKNQGTPIVRIQNLTGLGKTVYSDLTLDANKYIENGDLIYAWSATFGPYLWKGKKSIYHYHIWKIECDNNLLNKTYFYYTLKHISDALKEAGGTGTLFVHITKGFIENYTIKVPDLPTQTAIAEILSSLDDKIELNNKISQELETLAQTLFKQWFIDFEFPNENGEPYKSSGGEMIDSELGEIPKGWEVGTFGDLCKIVNGFAFKSKDFEELGSNRILKIRNVNGSVVDIINTQFVDSTVVASVQDKFRVLPGHILIAMTGAEVGKIGLVPQTEKNLWLNQRVGRFAPIINNTLVFIYQLFKALNFTQAVRNSAMGSAQPNISASGIESLNCIIPPKEIVQNFSKINQHSFNLTLENLGENQELTTLRDTLLPKLISGELEVSELLAQNA